VSTTKSSLPAILLFRFGPYEVDISRNELRKFGQRVRLEPKPWQLLISLLQRPGELVTRAELQRAVWSEDVFVDFEHGLNVAVRKLRAVLNDSVDAPKYIETVAREGYRLIATVEHVFANVSTLASAQTVVQTDAIRVPVQGQPEAATSRDQEAQHPTDALLPWLQKRGKRWREVTVLTFVALIAITAMRFFWRGLRGAPPAAAERVMIVVLPFENLSGDPDQEYLSDGMTEELSGRLGNLSPQQLGVIGRTSAMTYKSSQRTISQIGKELAVSYVLEGSVRRNGSKLRVTAQLVKVSDQAHVWAEDYDRDVSDLLQVEDEVALQIAQQVGVSVAGSQPAKASPKHLPNSEAHEAYLLGRYWWNKRTPAGWNNAVQYFRRAIEKDPEYAAAYAGLGECARIPREEALAAARKAVELDSSSGEARAALGWAELYKDLDVVAAEDALKSAIKLDPNYAPAHHTYAAVLDMTGRLREAIREEEQAVLLDPLFLISRAALAGLFSAAGQNERGIEQLKQIFAIEPQFPKAHEVLGDIYSRKGMYKEAIREYQISEQYGGDKLPGLLGYAYARAGNKDGAMEKLAELKTEKRNNYYDLAMIEMGLGDKDAAVAWLQRLYQEQVDDDGLVLLRCEPRFDPLRSEPRFQNLLRRMKLISESSPLKAEVPVTRLSR
jgi:TolB-like protein/DNA-binding winged helix-turn-helix (wHTH) protein/Flp pilus assembly protein TadD